MSRLDPDALKVTLEQKQPNKNNREFSCLYVVQYVVRFLRLP
jgi:hypothetical protein